MATSIHHGPPGSYKSFTLVQRFAIPALKEGRVVVTNIRGFDDLERVKDQFPDDDFHSDADIIWVDTTSQTGRKFMAQWWHWVPFGSLVIIDEVQQVYPDRRDFKLESLDKFTPPPGLVIEDLSLRGIPEGRPEDVFTAYDKQRHYNWDIFCSTPNIAKVKKEIREVSEWAYRHRDLSGLLPWKKNTWMEHQHDPEASGKSASHRVGAPVQYKADPRVFKCYKSTATGEHVQSKAGRSIFSDPKILAACVLIAVSIVAMVYFYGKRFGSKAPVAAPAPAVAAPQKPVDPGPVPASSGGNAVVSNQIPVIQPNEPLKFLDRDHVRLWSVQGVTLDELKIVPASCRISSASVKCSLPFDKALIRVSFNYFCYPSDYKIKMCDFLFFVNRPKPVEPDNKETVLAKAMPF